MIFRAIGDVALSMSREEDELESRAAWTTSWRWRCRPRAMAEYRHFERDQATELWGEEVTAASAAALANKLLQWADGAVYDDGGEAQEVHRAKLDALAGIIEEAQGQPVLVFYAFRHNLDRLRAAYPACKALGAHGATWWSGGTAGRCRCCWRTPSRRATASTSRTAGTSPSGSGSPGAWRPTCRPTRAWTGRGRKKRRSPPTWWPGTVDERVMDVLAGKRTLQDAMMDALRGGGEENDMGRYLELEDMPLCRAWGCAPVIKGNRTLNGCGNTQLQCPECGIRTGQSATSRRSSGYGWPSWPTRRTAGLLPTGARLDRRMPGRVRHVPRDGA
ncbi:MAG: hypothetical protein V8S24_07205 [Gordonibacter pamelaeae]